MENRDLHKGSFNIVDRGKAYDKICYMVDLASVEGELLEIRLLATKDGMDILESIPPDLKDKIRHTGFYSNLEMGVYRVYADTLFIFLGNTEVKTLLKSVLDTQKWFTVRDKNQEIYYSDL